MLSAVLSFLSPLKSSGCLMRVGTYILALVGIGVLLYFIIDVPKYRYYAIIAVVLIVAIKFRLWRFTPCERASFKNQLDKDVEAATSEQLELITFLEEKNKKLKAERDALRKEVLALDGKIALTFRGGGKVGHHREEGNEIEEENQEYDDDVHHNNNTIDDDDDGGVDDEVNNDDGILVRSKGTPLLMITNGSSSMKTCESVAGTSAAKKKRGNGKKRGGGGDERERSVTSAKKERKDNQQAEEKRSKRTVMKKAKDSGATIGGASALMKKTASSIFIGAVSGALGSLASPQYQKKQDNYPPDSHPYNHKKEDMLNREKQAPSAPLCPQTLSPQRKKGEPTESPPAFVNDGSVTTPRRSARQHEFPSSSLPDGLDEEEMSHGDDSETEVERKSLRSGEPAPTTTARLPPARSLSTLMPRSPSSQHIESQQQPHRGDGKLRALEAARDVAADLLINGTVGKETQARALSAASAAVCDVVARAAAGAGDALRNKKSSGGRGNGRTLNADGRRTFLSGAHHDSSEDDENTLQQLRIKVKSRGDLRAAAALQKVTNGEEGERTKGKGENKKSNTCKNASKRVLLTTENKFAAEEVNNNQPIHLAAPVGERGVGMRMRGRSSSQCRAPYGDDDSINPTKEERGKEDSNYENSQPFGLQLAKKSGNEQRSIKGGGERVVRKKADANAINALVNLARTPRRLFESDSDDSEQKNRSPEGYFGHGDAAKEPRVGRGNKHNGAEDGTREKGVAVKEPYSATAANRKKKSGSGSGVFALRIIDDDDGSDEVEKEKRVIEKGDEDNDDHDYEDAEEEAIVAYGEETELFFDNKYEHEENEDEDNSESDDTSRSANRFVGESRRPSQMSFFESSEKQHANAHTGSRVPRSARHRGGVERRG